MSIATARALRCLTPLLLMFAGTALAETKEEGRTENALRVLEEVMSAPDRRIPDKLLGRAEAIAVIPDVIKASLVIGGRRGKGLIAVRAPDGTWSNPSFVTLTGGSIGFQAGVQSTDVVLVFRTRRGVDGVVNGKFTLGADASVAAGPVGRAANASTDAQLKAEIYSYSRNRGLFAGVALDGAVIAIDHDANQSAYGGSVSARRIFEGGVAPQDDILVRFRDAIEEYTAE